MMEKQLPIHNNAERQNGSGAAQTRQQPAAHNASSSPNPSKKTTGERYYDVVQFLVGKAWIMFFTAVLAFVAKYGEDPYAIGKFKMPNYLQRFQHWFEKDLLTKKIPLSKQGEVGQVAAAAAASTMVLMWGGNLFAPVMRWMENGKEDIATYFNKKYGKPGEVEIGHERLKDTPQQSWGDILVGRFAAWGIVFSSFLSLYFIAGKTKEGMRRFDAYEEGFGRWLAGFTRKGKELNLGLPKKTGIPLSARLNPVQDANQMYRFGKIVALDVYATSAAIFIWNAISRLTARKRQEKLNGHLTSAAVDVIAAGAASQAGETLLPEAEPVISHVDKLNRQQRQELADTPAISAL